MAVGKAGWQERRLQREEDINDVDLEDVTGGKLWKVLSRHSDGGIIRMIHDP